MDVKYSFLRERSKGKYQLLKKDYLRWSARVSRLQEIPNTAIRSKIQAEESVLETLKIENWNGMVDIFLEWKIVVGQRWFTSGHRTVEGEEEARKIHGGTIWLTLWEAETWKKIGIFGVWEWKMDLSYTDPNINK